MKNPWVAAGSSLLTPRGAKGPAAVAVAIWRNAVTVSDQARSAALLTTKPVAPTKLVPVALNTSTPM